MIKSQLHRKKNNPTLPKSKALISVSYIKKGNPFSIKKGKTGKRIIPGIVEKERTYNKYPV